MKIVAGNIWTYHPKHWVVITTNIGWKKDGSNPMGRGIAMDAAKLYPDLPVWYGIKCQKFAERLMVLPHLIYRLILFPTKPLDKSQPWASWRQDSSIDLIKKSVRELRLVANLLESRDLLHDEIIVPMVGCQNGRLSTDIVMPILEELDDRFLVIRNV